MLCLSLGPVLKECTLWAGSRCDLGHVGEGQARLMILTVRGTLYRKLSAGRSKTFTLKANTHYARPISHQPVFQLSTSTRPSNFRIAFN